MVEIKEPQFSAWWMGCAERNGQNTRAFAPYVRDGDFDPTSMSGEDIVALLRDLEDGGFMKELAA